MLSALVFACVGWQFFVVLRPAPVSGDRRPDDQPAG
jgi:hypothetical protein